MPGVESVSAGLDRDDLIRGISTVITNSRRPTNRRGYAS